MLQMSGLLGDRLLSELDARALGTEAVERTLAREAEHGRLLRLLVRLSMVHERPRPDASSEWSETGESAMPCFLTPCTARTGCTCRAGMRCVVR